LLHFWVFFSAWLVSFLSHLSCELLLLQSDGEDGSLKVDYFTFAPNLADYISSSALVISHAGVCIIAFHLNQKKTSLVGI
jgi:UDP-N-acetylglucosamine transferase subunit ALG13